MPRHLTVIGTVAGNTPYLGVLITAMGIMLTFRPMGMDSGAPRS
ncbi:hypothetical protein EVC37_08365 [Methylocaldum sp. BRCS4]|nr:hypothetical protein [Methylocaldum sp. BRCS4]